MAYKPKVLAVVDGGTGLATTTINQLLYSSSANTVAGLATVNSGILATNSSGVPSITTASGNWLNTTRTAFSAYQSASTGNDVTGDGTVYTVICDTELFDQAANYNNATGTFTAPVAGVYSFSGAITCANYTGGPFDNIVDFNCSTAGVFRVSRSYWSVLFNNPQQSFTLIVKLALNETVTMRITGNGGAKVEGVIGSASPFQTFFSGFLIG